MAGGTVEIRVGVRGQVVGVATLAQFLNSEQCVTKGTTASLPGYGLYQVEHAPTGR